MYYRDEDREVGSKSKVAGGSARRKVDSQRLFVCNLSPCTTQQDLKELFSLYGNVTSANLIRGRESGMPRGIAFVTMSTPQEAKAALESRPHQLNGRRIVVQQAYPRSSSRKTANTNDVGIGHQLVVHEIPQNTSKKDIQKLFTQFGAIKNVRIDEVMRKAFVDFSNAVSLQIAMMATPIRLKDVTVGVSLPNDKERRQIEDERLTFANISDRKAKADAISTRDDTFCAPISGIHSSNKSNCREDSEPRCACTYCSNDKVKVDGIDPQLDAHFAPVYGIRDSVQGSHLIDYKTKYDLEISSNKNAERNWTHHYEEDDPYENGLPYTPTYGSNLSRKDSKWEKEKRSRSGCVLQ